MSTITSLGTGSGLDLEGMVTKLMAVESQPLTALKTKVTKHEARISSLGTLNTSLDALQVAAAALKTTSTQTAAEKYATLSVSSSASTVATATTTTGATAGSHSLVVANIATTQQIQKTGISVPTVAGSLSIKVGTGAAISVALDAGSTLSTIATAINKANTGVTATIITSGTTSTLSLTSTATGAANTIAITGADTTGGGTTWATAFGYSADDAATTSVDETNGWTATTPKDAALTVDGVSVTSASNTMTSVSGLSISLVAAGSTTVTVAKDTTTALSSALTAFVTAYNSSITTMSGLNAYNATTKVAGALQGDSTLVTAQKQIRNLLYGTTAGGTSAYQNLSNIGISVETDGTLTLDSSALNKAISADFTGVATLVAKVGDAYNTTLENIAGSKGSLVQATTSETSIIKTLTERETTLSARLTSIEKIYRTQFTALDTLLAGLNSTSSYLTQQLAALASSS